jgi:type II secretory pathway pseudopilin PulG
MKQHGFTILEIVIGISVIVVITAVSITSYSSFLKSSYDSRRKLDIEQIASALEQYRSNNVNGTYPTSLSVLVSGGYLKELPKDPETKRDYTYNIYPVGCTNNCTNYSLQATLSSNEIFESTPLRSSVVTLTPTARPTPIGQPTATPTRIPTVVPTNILHEFPLLQ